MPEQEYILLVMHDRDTEDLVRDLVEEQLAKRLENGKVLRPGFDYARCEEDAKQKLKENQYHLLVTQLGIPETKKSPLAEEEKRGIKLLKFVKSEKPNLPCIVLAKNVDNRLILDMKDFERCELVGAGEMMEEGLKKSLDRIFGRRGRIQDKQRDIIDVEITLEEPSRGSYRIKGTSPDVCRYEGPLTIEKEQYERLLVGSELLQKLSENETLFDMWRKQLRLIGEDLLTALLEKKDFCRDFFSATRGHIDKSRIVFNVGEEVYPIPLEAIWDEREKFWMLEAPVMRKLPRPTKEYPLFTDAETKNSPINCLIIESAVDGYVGENVGELRELRNVPKECEWLKNFTAGTKEIKPTVQFGQVLRIREDADRRSFRKQVEEALKGTWHVVHYAGHSYYDKEQDRGYVFFPGRKIEKVDIEEFGMWLRGTRFVYMSSCHSSESSIIFELARNLVPAIVGFRWDIDDDRAAEHAQVFYTDLFAKSHSIEYAFLKARQEMYKKYKDKGDKTWAAAMLILQLTG